MSKTKRYCQTMDLKDDPALIEEYKHWHKPEEIWPEIVKGIRAVEISEMEIYIYKNTLFMIVETPIDFDWDKNMKALASLPRQAEWEAFMSKYQKASPDSPSGEKWHQMELMFKLSDC